MLKQQVFGCFLEAFILMSGEWSMTVELNFLKTIARFEHCVLRLGFKQVTTVDNAFSRDHLS